MNWVDTFFFCSIYDRLVNSVNISGAATGTWSSCWNVFPFIQSCTVSGPTGVRRRYSNNSSVCRLCSYCCILWKKKQIWLWMESTESYKTDSESTCNALPFGSISRRTCDYNSKVGNYPQHCWFYRLGNFLCDFAVHPLDRNVLLTKYWTKRLEYSNNFTCPGQRACACSSLLELFQASFGNVAIFHCVLYWYSWYNSEFWWIFQINWKRHSSFIHTHL